jgi:hypothetical protein
MMPRVTEAFKAQYNYQAMLSDPNDPLGPPIPNPETEAQFVRRMIRNYVKELTTTHESAGAADSARNSAINKTRTDFGT